MTRHGQEYLRKSFDFLKFFQKSRVYANRLHHIDTKSHFKKILKWLQIDPGCGLFASAGQQPEGVVQALSSIDMTICVNIKYLHHNGMVCHGHALGHGIHHVPVGPAVSFKFYNV